MDTILQFVIFFLEICRLMFNPYSEKIYDYLGGIEDIKKAKVCGTYLFDICTY
jgi:hypothetical protein